MALVLACGMLSCAPANMDTQRTEKHGTGTSLHDSHALGEYWQYFAASRRPIEKFLGFTFPGLMIAQIITTIIDVAGEEHAGKLLKTCAQWGWLFLFLWGCVIFALFVKHKAEDYWKLQAESKRTEDGLRCSIQMLADDAAAKYSELEDELNTIRDGAHQAAHPEDFAYEYRLPASEDAGLERLFTDHAQREARPYHRVEILAIDDSEDGTTPLLARQALIFARRLRRILLEAKWNISPEIKRYNDLSMQDALRNGITIHCANDGSQWGRFIDTWFRLQKNVPVRMIYSATDPQPVRIYIGPFVLPENERALLIMHPPSRQPSSRS